MWSLGSSTGTLLAATRSPPGPSGSLCAGGEHLSHGEMAQLSLSPSAPQLGLVQEEMPKGHSLDWKSYK